MWKERICLHESNPYQIKGYSYLPADSTTKNTVGIVLLPTVSREYSFDLSGFSREAIQRHVGRNEILIRLSNFTEH